MTATELMAGIWDRLPARVRAVLRAWRNPPMYPSAVQIEHINRCNLKCAMCQHGYGVVDKKPDMPLEIFRRAVDEIRAGGHLECVHLQGLGEPLLHRHIFEMIEYAQSLGLKTDFNTNMTIMTDEMAERLVRSGHNHIAVSLESADPGVYAHIRCGGGPNLLARVLENIERIQRAKEKLGRDNPEVVVYAIIMKHTAAHIPELVEALRRRGVRRLAFQDLITAEIPDSVTLPDGTPLATESISSWPVEKQRDTLDLIRAQNSDDMEVVPPHYLDYLDGSGPPPLGVRTCLDLWERPMIAVDGVVTPCCYGVGNPHLDMGNIFTASFEDIWFGERFQRLRRQHVTNRHPHVCAHCFQLYQVAEPPSQLKAKPGEQAPWRYPNTFLGDRAYALRVRRRKPRQGSAP